MAASHGLRTAASFVSLTTVVASIVFSSAVRGALRAIFSPTQHPLRFIALVLALVLNGKSLPFIWHFRFVRIMLYQLYMQPTKLPKDALFRPMVTSAMYTPLPECDYNGHKSNSTYFADLDMARTQLISCLLRKGIRRAGQRHDPSGRRVDSASPPSSDPTKLQQQTPSTTTIDGSNNGDGTAQAEKPHPAEAVKGRFAIALGAVSCHFKREIKPYERFEIWTRVLAWDRKWVYVVSHMVRLGAVKPDGWDLQPWRSSSTRSHTKGVSERQDKGSRQLPALDAERRAECKNAIFATSISKYVVKKGRLTISPEVVLQNSDLLPPKPGQAGSIDGEDVNWTWEHVEEERQRGLRLAEKFGDLDGQDGLHDEFPVSGLGDGGVGILGEFKDLYFG